MGKILMTGAGGGVKSDDVTASKWDVVKTKKTITTDSDDEVVYGTLPDHLTNVLNRGARINGSVYQIAVPKGAYRLDNVRLGAGQPLISDAGGIVQVTLSELREHIGYTDPTRVRNDTTIAGQKGTMPEQGAMTLNPGTTAKTGAVSGKYMTGNVTVPAINIPAAYIKKGQKITFPDGSSVTGTFEGWVPVATDIYYRGTIGFGGSFVRIVDQNRVDGYLKTDKIYWAASSLSINIAFATAGTVDVHKYSKIIIEGSGLSTVKISVTGGSYSESSSGRDKWYFQDATLSNSGGTFSLTAGASHQLGIYLKIPSNHPEGYITRIRLE